MNLFPEAFVTALIIGALIWTALGVALLVVLVWRDCRNKTLW